MIHEKNFTKAPAKRPSTRKTPSHVPSTANPVPAVAPSPAPKPVASLKDELAPPPVRRLTGYARLTWLHEQLRSGCRWNKRTLAKEFEISRSVLKRLLRVFQIDFQQELGFDMKRHTFYLLDPDKSLPHIPATEGELFSLLMAQEALAAHHDSLFGRSLQGAIDKLAASVDRSLHGGLAELKKAVCFRTLGGSVRHSALIFDTVAEALSLRRELHFDYLSHERGLAHWKAQPRCLVRQDGVWYLLCHRGGKQGYTVSLSRMSNPRLGDKTFEPEGDGPTLRERLSSSIGIFGGRGERVRLRFQGVAARLVGEMALHPSQEMNPLGEDGLELTMEVAVNPELERWILGWGEQAEVLESAALREKIIGRLRQTAARYQAPPSPSPAGSVPESSVAV